MGRVHHRRPALQTRAPASTLAARGLIRGPTWKAPSLCGGAFFRREINLHRSSEGGVYVQHEKKPAADICQARGLGIAYIGSIENQGTLRRIDASAAYLAVPDG